MKTQLISCFFSLMTFFPWGASVVWASEAPVQDEEVYVPSSEEKKINASDNKSISSESKDAHTDTKGAHAENNNSVQDNLDSQKNLEMQTSNHHEEMDSSSSEQEESFRLTSPESEHPIASQKNHGMIWFVSVFVILLVVIFSFT